MIRINLLPPEARRKVSARKVLPVAVPWRRVGIGAAVFVAVSTVGLWAVNRVQAAMLGRLKAEWERLQPERTHLEESRRVFQSLQQRSQILHGVKAPEAKWAPRLNLFSDCLVSRLWFSSFRWRQGERARVEGSTLASSAASPGSAPISRFLQRLKEHQEFSHRFREVELQSVEQRQIAGEEVVDFSILFTPTE